MKTARPCLAGAAALALTLAIALAPGPGTAAAPPEQPPPKRDPASPYANTAVGAVIDANGGKIPATGEELVAALAKFGDVMQLPVPFSAVALNSGLTHPRVVITMRPSTTPPPKSVFVPDGRVARQSGGFGWSGGVSGTTKLIPQPPESLNKLPAVVTQLQGRLFLAANTELGAGGVKVRTVEFVSWNSRRLKFDFGVIEGLNTDAPELKILDGVRCFSCHKNKGPILGGAPWSNTAHNAVVRKTAIDALKPGAATDGVAFHDPHGLEVDAAVRIGGDLLRDRALFKRLAEMPDGRKALALLFETILRRGPLEKHDKEARGSLNALLPGRFVRDALNAKQNAAPDTLRDYSPAGPVAREVIVHIGARGGRNQVAVYDEARAAGQPRLPSEYLPSNPKAFAPPEVKPAQHPAEVVSAVLLAQTMGLTEKDREFLTDALDEAVKRLNAPALTRAAVAGAIFNGPAFADVMATGVLPDRDDFKDRFVAGVLAVFKSQKLNDAFWAARDTYASAPPFDPLAGPEKEVAALPSHACLACHDVLGAKKAAFNPIPALPFDPFDATARAAWVKSNDRKRKAEVLGRMHTRLSADRDMPPEDSTEHALYRVKDPAALNAVKDWLDAELKKVK
jgi:hypothetical protein